LLDDDVAGTANHQQVFDIVAPDQNQPPAAIDNSSINNGQPRLPPARGSRSQPIGSVAANKPKGCADETKRDYENDEEFHDR
jgi:hypothetical protein